jgi:hypothetical protein
MIHNDFEFEKNKYFLKNPDLIEQNIPKEKCAENCADNNYDGFMYKGDDNKCLLFGNTRYTKKIDDNLLVNYNDIKSFIRTKDYLDAGDFNDLIDYPNYYKETNNYYKYQPDNLLMEYSVLNQTECMEKCVEMSPQCKSIIYLNQPKECIYSKEKIMKQSKNNLSEHDIYTVKNKNSIKNKDKKNKINDNHANKNKIIYDDIYDDKSKYTKCKSYDDTDNLLTMKKAYNETCRDEFGKEYVFDDNIFDTKSVFRCDENDTKKVKCKIDYFNEYTDPSDPNLNYNTNIELFSNKKNNDGEAINNQHNSMAYVLLFMLLLIFIIIIFYGFYYK